MKTFGAIALVAVAACCGCVSRQYGASGLQPCQLRQGVTTPRDVVGAWGNPASIDDDVWTWNNSWELGGKLEASWNILGVTIFNYERATRQIRLEFDANGKLASVQRTNTIPGGVKWHLSPWW